MVLPPGAFKDFPAGLGLGLGLALAARTVLPAGLPAGLPEGAGGAFTGGLPVDFANGLLVGGFLVEEVLLVGDFLLLEDEDEDEDVDCDWMDF